MFHEHVLQISDDSEPSSLKKRLLKSKIFKSGVMFSSVLLLFCIMLSLIYNIFEDALFKAFENFS